MKAEKHHETYNSRLCLELLLEAGLEGDGVSSELADTLRQLVHGHGLLVEVEAELGLVVEVAALRDVELGGVLGRELLRHGVLAVVQLLEEVRGNGEVVAAGELGDLTNGTEGSTHDDGVVAVLLVVVEDLLDGLDTWVLLLGVLLLGGGLVPVKNTADEGGDEVGTGLSTGDSLDQREHERQVAVDAMLVLELMGSLDTLPGGGKLDEDTVLADTLLLVELLSLLAKLSKIDCCCNVDIRR